MGHSLSQLTSRTMSLPPPLPVIAPKPRSKFITLLAWLMMIVGGIGLPISLISMLMIIAHSNGTEKSDPVGFCIVVLGPALLLVCGFGLLRRWWFAWVGTLVLLVVFILSNVRLLIQGPRPETTTYDSTGVPTTVMGSGANYSSVPIIAVCAGLITKLLSRGVRDNFTSPLPPANKFFSPATLHPSWRVGHTGRDMMYYEEKVNGQWERIDISGEMLMGRAHHVIYFASSERWLEYPEWARHRRGEIIERIKSEFREPDYEYHGL